MDINKLLSSARIAFNEKGPFSLTREISQGEQDAFEKNLTALIKALPTYKQPPRVCPHRSGSEAEKSALPLSSVNEDVPELSVARKTLLSSAPATRDGCFSVPRAIE